MSEMNEKGEPVFGEGNTFKPDEGLDIEGRRDSTMVHGRKMSRIGPPPKIGSLPDTSGSDDEYGKLVAMEANDAIKYRTCSWQKVVHSSAPETLFTEC